jgi:hypothetical protein
MRRGMPPAGGPVMFGRGPARVDVTLDPLVGIDDTSKPLRSKLLAVPALRARYLSYVREIAERWLDWQTLEPWRDRTRRHRRRCQGRYQNLYTLQAFEAGVSEGASLKVLLSQACLPTGEVSYKQSQTRVGRHSSHSVGSDFRARA